MDPIIKDKWLKALRSGEYKQGHKFLYNSNDDTYCCLGVLACVVDYDKELLHGLFLPADLHPEEWPMSLYNEGNPEIEVDGNITTLAEFNDGGASFEIIADIIEEQL